MKKKESYKKYNCFLETNAIKEYKFSDFFKETTPSINKIFSLILKNV